VPSDRTLDLPFWPCFLCGAAQEVGVVVTALCEHAPGHAREFCGEGNNQDIGVEPLGRCLQPGSEAMPRPTLTLQKYGSSALNEQRSQVPITAPRYAPENGSIAGRDLLRYETKPCCKVSALMEGITGSDGGDHRA
jgi:hypothetical protein